jgi:hypothetical protein
MKKIDQDQNLSIDEQIEIRKENKKWIDEHLNCDDPKERYYAEGFLERGEYWNHMGLSILKNHGLTEEKFKLLFHDLWGAASETAKYDKAAWKNVRAQLGNVGLRI